MFEYFTHEEANLFTFYRIPKELFTNPNYKNLSAESKILYGLLLDRNSLSIQNNWFDDEGHIYIYYSREEVMELLNIGGRDKVGKLFSELRKIELIREVRQGLGKPNIIYVGKFIPSKPYNPSETRINSKKSQNRTSSNPKIRHQKVPKSDTNNTYGIILTERDLHTQPFQNLEGADTISKSEKPCVCVNTPQKEEVLKESINGEAKGEEKKSNPVKYLKEEIKKVTGYQVPEQKIKELLTASSLERVQFHLENWDIHKAYQKSEGAGWFFTVIQNDITPEQKKISGTGEKREEKIPQRDNFEQREWTREYAESFYHDLTEEIDWEADWEKKARLEAEKKAEVQPKVKLPYDEVKGHIQNMRQATQHKG